MTVLTVTHTRTHNETRYADPYKQCMQCHGWIDGFLDNPGRPILVPCEHQADYRSVCPSWSPVDGCECAEYNERHPDDRITHPMRERPAEDDRPY